MERAVDVASAARAVVRKCFTGAARVGRVNVQPPLPQRLLPGRPAHTREDRGLAGAARGSLRRREGRVPWPPAVRKHQRPEEACGANRSREEEGAVAAGGPNAAAGGLFSPFLGIERGLPLAFRHLSAPSACTRHYWLEREARRALAGPPEPRTGGDGVERAQSFSTAATGSAQRNAPAGGNRRYCAAAAAPRSILDRRYRSSLGPTGALPRRSAIESIYGKAYHLILASEV